MSTFRKVLSRSFIEIAIGVVVGTSSSTWAAALTPGDILVSSTKDFQSSVLREYTPSGTLVQTFSVPVAPGGDTFARGIATDNLGNVQIYNGTFSPYLTTLDPRTGTFTNHTLDGWSTINNSGFGGVVVNGNFAYASDMATAGPGSPNGIVRFDLSSFSAIRFASGPSFDSGDYNFVGLGLDGKLYAQWPSSTPMGNRIDVIDPKSMSKTTINLPSPLQIAGATADKAGTIYAVGWLGDGNIYKLDRSGNVLSSIATGFRDLTGLSISNSGELLTASSDGEVILTDTNFSQLTSFNVGSQLATFDAFVTPEPSGLAIMIIGVGFIVFLFIRR